MWIMRNVRLEDKNVSGKPLLALGVIVGSKIKVPLPRKFVRARNDVTLKLSANQ